MNQSQTGRKALRKEKRKSKKSAKDVAYKSHSVIKAGKVNKPSYATQNDSKKIKSLKKMINKAKLEMNASNVDKAKSKTNLHKDVSNETKSNGPTFKKNLDSRMAALEEYINNEVNVSSSFDHGKKEAKKVEKNKSGITGKKTLKKPKNMIKDKKKLKALEKGIADDDREINEMYRQMHLNVKQKKSTTILRNIFGDDICDIFDVLESEPSEANLLAEQSTLVVPKESKPLKKKKKDQIPVPENAIVVDTRKPYFEQDKVPLAGENKQNNFLKSATVTANLSTTAVEIGSDNNGLEKKKSCSPQNSKKRKLLSNNLNSDSKTIIPIEWEFEGNDEGEEEKKLPSKKMKKLLSKAGVSVVEVLPPLAHLNSIIKVSKKKSKKKDKRLSVSFNLSKNAIKIIPALKKTTGVLVKKTSEHDGIPNEHSVDDFDELNLFLDSMGDGEDAAASMFDEDNFASLSDQEISSEEEGVDETLVAELSDCENDSASEQEAGQNDEGNISDEWNEDSDIDMEAEFTDSDDGSINIDSQLDEGEELSDTENVSNGTMDDLTEDIYGRLRDKQGNIVVSTAISSSAYTSPECRKKDPQLQEQLSSDAIKRVRTQLRGRLNRLAEVNLAGTVTMVSSLYKEHPRQLLNVVLAELLLRELAADLPTLDRHCQECAVLLVAVAANVAEEVGAHILTDFVMSWHSELEKECCNSLRLRNMIMFVSHLYGFGLMHSVLLFDMLRLLVNNLTACNVDQLVQVVGSVGFQLRKDDPEGLRGVILAVQQHSAEAATTAAPPQLELLSLMLRAVKNNNESKMPQYDPTYTEHLRKLLRAFVGGDNGKSSPVRVTLEDLLLSETRGRWWVVGSAWTGGSLLRDTTPAASFIEGRPANASSQETTKFSDSFMKLAESMRITRPPKINILFALTVGSQDTKEAFLKLSQLSLTLAQEKLIFDVMLYCVQKMRLYKPFYMLLSMDLCTHDAKYKRMLQHSLWDKFSDLDALKTRELKNLAKFVVDVVKEDTLNLSVLKTLPFADANKKVVSFLEDIFCQLFESPEGCHISSNAFKQLFKSKKLQPLRMQFRVFLQVFIAPKFENDGVLTKNPLFRQRLLSAMDTLSSDQGALL